MVHTKYYKYSEQILHIMDHFQQFYEVQHDLMKL